MLKEKIYNYINSEDYKGQTKEELAKTFGLSVGDYREFLEF